MTRAIATASGGEQQPLFGVPQTAKTSNDYYTPKWVFDRMGIEFDLDVAAPPGGVSWIPAKRFYTMEDDGLAQTWAGRVWMNPPYSHNTPWARKFIDHANGVCLMPFAKSQWFIDMWSEADGIVVCRDGFFDFVGGSIFMAVFFAAFGDECVEAIARIGTVRRPEAAA